jgi:hypothetical protein
MSTRRLVDIAVPNATDAPAVVLIRIAHSNRLPGSLSFGEGSPLDVRGFGLTTDRCDPSPCEKLPHEVTLKIGPRDMAFVRVVVETIDPPAGRPAHAVFEVTDERQGAIVGGVTVVATTTPPIDTGDPKPANPCPLVLAGDLYTVELGESPDVKAPPAVVAADRPRQLVVPITNSSSDHLERAVAYLEHLDTSNVRFDPVTWTLGSMEPGATFWTTWTIDARGAEPGAFEASIVVRDEKHDPIRLRASFRVPDWRR